MKRFVNWRIVVLAAALALVGASASWAFQQLPTGGQVNDDPLAGISASAGVSGLDPANADVVGGALTAGKVAVPWAIFRQQTPAAGADQVFVRSFAGGAWTTRGAGTLGGRSSAAPTFSGSLNFDQGQDGEAPSIDFAGAGRTVPWATWYENTTGISFGADNIFASRFDNSNDANQGKWIFEGQGRGTGGGTTQVPSLNIHTNRDAEDPSVAGGATVAGNAPAPWVTWSEVDGNASTSPRQIFTSKAVRPTTPPTCPADGGNAFKPPLGPSATGAVATFCWQQVGLERLDSSPASIPSSTIDPSMNVDPTRDGIEPDIAFTGTNDTVPWVVWYETSTDSSAHPSTLGLNNNEMVFAAKGVGDASADGQFHWTVVGSQLQGTLDNTSPPNGFGTCAASVTNEEHCSLNKDATKNAEDPRVAAGTMTSGAPTVPWVAWDEDLTGTGNTQIFVSRLVGAGATAHFELANNGSPISLDSNPSTRPDITFSGNTPYVSWREDIGGGNDKGFVGHFVLDNTGVPIFHIDESDIPLTPSSQADVRVPISSGCTANPFNADGAACQGAVFGTPFYLFTNGTSPRSLFAGAYQPDAPATGTASSITPSTATLNGSVNPEGAPVSVSFWFGPTTAYGNATPLQTLAPSIVATAFTAQLTGLAPSSTVHYKAVVSTDFGTFMGADQTLKTSAPPDRTPPKVSVKIGKSTIAKLLKSKKLTLRVTISEAGRVTLAASTSIKSHHKHKIVGLGSARVTFSAKGAKTVKISVPSSALRKLRGLHTGTTIMVRFSGIDSAGNKSPTRTASARFPRR